MDNVAHYQITKTDYYKLYNLLVVDYLEKNISYDYCVIEAFEYLKALENTILPTKPFRLICNFHGIESYFSFYVDFNNRKIIYEGLLSYKIINDMRIPDVYISVLDIDEICNRYYLERKSDRKIKIERLLKND